MKIIKFLLLLFLVLVVTPSCEHEPFPPPPPNHNPIDTTDPNDTNSCHPDTVYFDREVLPILSTNCAYSGCHDANTASEDVILDSYFNVMNSDADVRPGDPDGSDLYEVITEGDPDKRMPQPPNPPLSSSEIQTIKNWILQGAQNLSCDDCDTTDVSFANDIQPIFDQSCANCHSGGNAPLGIMLVSYGDITGAIQNQTVIQSINHEPGYTKMPPSEIKLDQCKLDKIDVWVSAGMPDN